MQTDFIITFLTSLKVFIIFALALSPTRVCTWSRAPLLGAEHLNGCLSLVSVTTVVLALNTKGQVTSWRSRCANRQNRGRRKGCWRAGSQASGTHCARGVSTRVTTVAVSYWSSLFNASPYSSLLTKKNLPVIMQWRILL